MSFNELNLDARLLRAIESLKFTTPTDIQKQAIPVVLEGHDLMASAQTGTGKTAAFMLPAMHKLLNSEIKPGKGPRVLVLTPTRELAQQVTNAVNDFGQDTKLRMGVIVGGVAYFHQERLLSKPCDILVATPGRLMDHIQRGRIDFSRLEMLILDEADRMLDMGFIDDIKSIVAKTPENRQTLLFSATLEGEVEEIAHTMLKNPQKIQVSGVKEKHASITQYALAADSYEHKIQLLERLLGNADLKQAVVFVGTKAGADEVADIVKAQGHFAASLHGDMKQSFRNKVIDRAHAGRLRVLVATDVAARGLDVKGVTHVINFDLPMIAEDYVHRIGRTGRGGATGTALTLVNPRDWQKMDRIERLTGQQLEEMVIEGLEPRSSRPKNRGRGGSGRPQRGNGGGRSRFADGGSRRGGYRGDNRSEGRSERPQREFADRKPREFGDRPQRDFSDRPQREFGDRAPREFSDRQPREFGDRPRRDDRPLRDFGERGPRREFADRAPRSDGERSERRLSAPRARSERRDDRPFRERSRREA